MVPLPAARRAGLATLTALLLAACAATPAATTTSAAPAAGTTSTTPATTTTTTLATTTVVATTTTAAAAPPTTTTEPPAPLRLTIVYDNTAADPRFGAAWGFSVLVEAPGGTLLFDTGGDGALLLANLALLDVAPAAITTVVLSHGHDDHTGGLQALLDAGAMPTVYLPASLPAGLRTRLAARTAVVEVSAPQEILPGVFSTGEMSKGIVEQALAIRTAAGTVVLTGCAHPGIVDIVERAAEVVPGPIALVIGGFHLLEASPAAVGEVVAAFRDMGVQQVAPTHCTGDAAIAAFAGEYGDGFVAAGAGRLIEVG